MALFCHQITNFFVLYYLLSYLEPGFGCKPSGGDIFAQGQYEMIRNATEIMGHLGTMHGTLLECGNICSVTPRCHGFTHSEPDVCQLYDYYPSTGNSVLVEDYYQLYCA